MQKYFLLLFLVSPMLSANNRSSLSQSTITGLNGLRYLLANDAVSGKRPVDDEQVFAFVRTPDGMITFTTDGRVTGLNMGTPYPLAPRPRFTTEPVIELEDKIAGTFNFMIGKRETWRLGLSAWRSLRYRNAWPGVDLVYRFEEQTTGLTLVLEARRSGDLANVVFDTDRALPGYSKDGHLLLSDSLELRMRNPEHRKQGSAPILWQTRRQGELRLLPTSVQQARTLAIDVVAGGFFGSSSGQTYEYGQALDLTADGDIILAGETVSADLPVTAGAFDTTYNGATETFLARISSDGSTVRWMTFYGGSHDDLLRAIAIDSQDAIWIAGITSSVDLPILNAYDPTFNGDRDVFLARFDGSGALTYASYFGGASYDFAFGLATGTDDALYLVGGSNSRDLPTTPGVLMEQTQVPPDGFIARFDHTGTLDWSTYLGGRSFDYIRDVTVISNGDLFITGYTFSSDFPVTPGAFQTRGLGGTEGFACRVAAQGDSLIWSSLISGSGSDVPDSITANDVGDVVVGGYTFSRNFPVTPGAIATNLR